MDSALTGVKLRIVLIVTAVVAMAATGCKETPPVNKPIEGTLPLLVILWDPQRPEVTVKPTREQVEELVFGAKPSIADFFETQSFGKVKIQKAGVFSYLADKPANHYWYHPAPGTPGGDEFISGHAEKWAEAIRKADREFNFAAYDTDKNGELSTTELGILIVIPQVSPFGTVRGLVGREHPSVQSLVVDGVKLKSMAEVYTGNGTSIGTPVKGIPMNFGVMAHELGHLFFKMVDMYYDGALRPGNYSLMDVTYTDAQYDPYHRVRTGWLTPQVVTQSGTYQLSSVERSGDLLKIIRPKHSPPEYFMIENRQHGVYDTGLPDTGLAIWRFTDNESASDWVRKNLHLIRSPLAQGDKNALWHGPDSPATTLKWTDGTSSGITVRGFSESASVMSLAIDMPAN